MTESKEDQIDLRTLVPGFRLDWSGLRNRFEDELPRFEKLTTYEMRAAYLDELARQFEEAITEALGLSASSPPVGGSGEVVTESTRLAAEQILVLHPHLPPLAAHLIKRVSQLPTALAAPVPNGVPEGAGREAGLREALVQVEAVRVSPQWSGKHADWICGAVRFEIEQLLLSALSASPVTPEGLSGGDADA